MFVFYVFHIDDEFIYSFILIMNLINALISPISLLLCNAEMASGTESEAGAEWNS